MKKLILLAVLFAMCGHVFGQSTVKLYGQQLTCFIENSGIMPSTASIPNYWIKIRFDSDGDPVSFVLKDDAGNVNEYDIEGWEETQQGFEVYSYDGPHKENYIGIRKNKKMATIHDIDRHMNTMHTYLYFGINPSSGGGYSGGGGGFSGGYGSSGGGSSYSSSQTCRSCGGSGRCTGCNGEGKYWVDSGLYTGSGSRTRVNCGSCGGSGRCRVCYGRGTIR